MASNDEQQRIALAQEIRAQVVQDMQAVMNEQIAAMRAQWEQERATLTAQSAAAAQAVATAAVASLPPAAPEGANQARPRMKWTEWSGNTELLAVWRQQVIAKIRNDEGALPDPEGIITIQSSLPVSHQPRTVGWINREATRPLGAHEQCWDMGSFLSHVLERCGDPEAANVAARRLDCLRQGRLQPFRESLQEFEVLHAKAESAGEVWTDGAKVRALQRSMNAELLEIGMLEKHEVSASPTHNHKAIAPLTVVLSPTVCAAATATDCLAIMSCTKKASL